MVLLVRRMGWQMLVNLLLTIGAFCARRLDRPLADRLSAPVDARARGARGTRLAGVMVFTAPIYLASIPEIQAHEHAHRRDLRPGRGRQPARRRGAMVIGRSSCSFRFWSCCSSPSC